MSRYRIVLECDGVYLPEGLHVKPVIQDDGSIGASVSCMWYAGTVPGTRQRIQFGDSWEYGVVYEDSPGPLVVVADGTGRNPNGVPGSVSVSVERVPVKLGAPSCALCGQDIWGELSFVSKGREVCADCRFAFEVNV